MDPAWSMYLYHPLILNIGPPSKSFVNTAEISLCLPQRLSLCLAGAVVCVQCVSVLCWRLLEGRGHGAVCVCVRERSKVAVLFTLLRLDYFIVWCYYNFFVKLMRGRG